MRKFIFLLTVLMFAVKLSAEKPNIVLFIADDLTCQDINCYGGQAITPNIDQLAAEGLKFNNFYQCVAVCAPLSG